LKFALFLEVIMYLFVFYLAAKRSDLLEGLQRNESPSPDGNGKLFAKAVLFFLLPKRDQRKRFREL
jgi:hypothetical protein